MSKERIKEKIKIYKVGLNYKEKEIRIQFFGPKGKRYTTKINLSKVISRNIDMVRKYVLNKFVGLRRVSNGAKWSGKLDEYLLKMKSTLANLESKKMDENNFIISNESKGKEIRVNNFVPKDLANSFDQIETMDQKSEVIPDNQNTILKENDKNVENTDKSEKIIDQIPKSNTFEPQKEKIIEKIESPVDSLPESEIPELSFTDEIESIKTKTSIKPNERFSNFSGRKKVSTPKTLFDKKKESFHEKIEKENEKNLSISLGFDSMTFSKSKNSFIENIDISKNHTPTRTVFHKQEQTTHKKSIKEQISEKKKIKQTDKNNFDEDFKDDFDEDFDDDFDDDFESVKSQLSFSKKATEKKESVEQKEASQTNESFTGFSEIQTDFEEIPDESIQEEIEMDSQVSQGRCSLVPSKNEEKVQVNLKKVEDLNKLSDELVRKKKEEMDVDFFKNQVKKGEEGFEYEKNMSFVQDESNDWDDSETDF